MTNKLIKWLVPVVYTALGIAVGQMLFNLAKGFFA